ncbi:hypothetical protein NC99_39940 [Sunxiuqinia dokdonensis]|uniref:Uncharacterized protein n=1 Tax=Sunxiuqinia dokdonensis TaxID=1409788 RepID=A0A0L8V3X5_9BACT|nr:hypothetical protein NC99_39940 [Sunxiuqinia dokdonensis]
MVVPVLPFGNGGVVALIIPLKILYFYFPEVKPLPGFFLR